MHEHIKALSNHTTDPYKIKTPMVDVSVSVYLYNTVTLECYMCFYRVTFQKLRDLDGIQATVRIIAFLKHNLTHPFLHTRVMGWSF